MKTLFHGTTKENFELIKKNGFAPEDMVWNCSNDSEMYFYDMDKTDFDCDESEEDKRNWCIGRAFESAQITAAVQGFLGSELIVFELQINSELTEDDWSCQNMSETATTVNIDDLNEQGEIVNVYSSESYNPSLRFFYVANLIMTNENMDSYRFTNMEREACEMIVKSEVDLCELMEIDWNVLNIEIEPINKLKVA